MTIETKLEAALEAIGALAIEAEHESSRYVFQVDGLKLLVNQQHQRLMELEGLLKRERLGSAAVHEDVKAMEARIMELESEIKHLKDLQRVADAELEASEGGEK